MSRATTLMFLLAIFSMAPSVFSVSDHLIYEISGQSQCREVTEPPTNDCRWKAGLYRHADETILGGTIVAYKLQWFSGIWSGWFVPGFNDIDGKINVYASTCDLPLKANSMRRWWAYFFDHNHTYVICKNV